MSRIALINSQNRKATLFQGAGTYSFTAPVNVSQVVISACASGGGGGGKASAGLGVGGGGGGGESCLQLNVSVTAGVAYTVTIGAGGTGGAVDTDGSDGTATSFDVLLSLAGGKGGKKGAGGANGASGAGGGTGTNINGSAGWGDRSNSWIPGSTAVVCPIPANAGPIIWLSLSPNQFTGMKGVVGCGGFGGTTLAAPTGGKGGDGFMMVEWGGH